MRERVLVLMCAAAAFMLPTACGGSSSSNTTAKFKSEYNQIKGPLNATSRAIGAEIEQASKQTDAQVGAAFHSLATRFQSQLSQLQTMKPPADLQSDWNTVISAGQRIETDLGDVVSAAATHSFSAAEQAGAKLVMDAEALKAAVAPIKAQLHLK